jgi:hypothetical protein
MNDVDEARLKIVVDAIEEAKLVVEEANKLI